MKIEIPENLEGWNARGADYLPGHLGMQFDRVEAEAVEARLAVARRHMAWNGFLHAGTITALADTCCGYGAVAALPDGADGFTTLDLSTSFVSTVREGVILCRATPAHLGRRTQVWDAKVSAEETGRALAHFRCTQLVLWPKS
ncbi:MAG: PaaI family thioesterase [Paracoccaceae bacterium]|nr:PaaI family thioesterase [Paracoccaceae bacterium]